MKKILLLIIVLILLTSCIRKYVVPKEIIKHNITSERLSHKETVSLVTVLTLPLLGIVVKDKEPGLESISSLQWLPVLNKEGELIEVKIDKNCNFEIKAKDGKLIKMLAKTAFIQNGYLRGKRSMIIGLAREVKIEDIVEIKMYTEFAKTRPLSEENLYLLEIINKK